MSEMSDAILLKVGNEAVKALKADELTQESVPKGSWEVSYTVEKSSLIYSIFLNYDAFIRNYAGGLADPTLWITIVALFTATALKIHASDSRQDLRIVFIVNGDGAETKDWKASCTIQELLNAGKEAEGKSLDDATTIMMITMDLDQR